jgi:hypothetical protein
MIAMLDEDLERLTKWFDVVRGQPRPKDIVQLSRDVGVDFPQDYVEFLSTYGSLWIADKERTGCPLRIYGFPGTGETATLDLRMAAKSDDPYEMDLGFEPGTFQGLLPQKILDELEELEGGEPMKTTAAIRKHLALVPFLSDEDANWLGRCMCFAKNGRVLDIGKGYVADPKQSFTAVVYRFLDGMVGTTDPPDGEDDEELSDYSSELSERAKSLKPGTARG